MIFKYMSKNSIEKISVHIISLGCPKNLVDTEIMAAILLKNGFALSSQADESQVMLINTCAFIKAARDESLMHIKKALKWKKRKKNRKIILCGCLNQLKTDQNSEKILNEVDLRINLNNIEKIAEKLNELFYPSQKLETIVDEADYLPTPNTPRLILTPPHYAYLKIADGCSNHCSYCSIPLIRGKFRSRKQNDLITEAENLLKNGTKEIILIAQDSTNYGNDINYKNGLVKLLDRLDNLNPEKYWIRLMYCHPKHFSNDLFSLLENSEHLLPYVDLPLQHISDKILKSMNRGVTTKQTKILIEKLRQLRRKVAIRTTFICGYPGETEDDFQELLNFVKESSFERLGAFIYSPEPGTAAFYMEDKVPSFVSEKRLSTLLNTQREISLANNKKMIGKEIEIILDKKSSEDVFIGRSVYDAPDIDNNVELKSKKNLKTGNILKVKVIGASEYDLQAQY